MREVRQQFWSADEVQEIPFADEIRDALRQLANCLCTHSEVGSQDDV